MIRIPLLKDKHNHLFTYSALNTAVSLFNVHNKEKALQIIVENSSKHKNILVFTGWFDSFYLFQNDELDNLPPIIICNNSLHKYFLNYQAKKIIEKDFIEWIHNNDNQEWVEQNLMKILAYISSLNKFDPLNLEIYLNESLLKGVAYQSDMFIKNNTIINYLQKIDFNVFSELWTDPDFYFTLPQNSKKLFAGVKIFTDGAIGAGTAAIQNYKTKLNPILIYSDLKLTDTLEKILHYNINVAIHCIGDIAIEQVLRVLSPLKAKINQYQVRLEHAQFISFEQAKKAKNLGLILSMQPNFSMDSIIYSDRLSDEYLVANNPFRMLIDKAGFIPGVDLIFGSDGMPTGAIDALQSSLFPPVPSQKVTIDEFIQAYCINNYDMGFIDVEIDQIKKKISINIENKLSYDLNKLKKNSG